MSLPGGFWEPTDRSLVDTALREAREEVGIPPELVTVVGTLPPYCRIIIGRPSIDQITTVIAALSPENNKRLKLTLNHDEVADVFWVPLDLFLGGSSHHTTVNYRYMNTGYTDNQFSLDHLGLSYTVWGLTASLCVVIATILLQTPTHFPFTVLLTRRMEEEVHVCVQAPLALHNCRNRENKTVCTAKL